MKGKEREKKQRRKAEAEASGEEWLREQVRKSAESRAFMQDVLDRMKARAPELIAEIERKQGR